MRSPAEGFGLAGAPACGGEDPQADPVSVSLGAVLDPLAAFSNLKYSYSTRVRSREEEPFHLWHVDLWRSQGGGHPKEKP